MPDREKVIATLEYCLEHGAMGGHDCWLHCDAKGNIKNSNARDKCPNKGCGTGCVVTPIREAIELLKAQEPRLYKPEELCAGMVVWVDQINWAHPSLLEIDRIIKYMPGEPWSQPQIPSPLGQNYKVFFRGSFLTEDINLYGNKIGWVAWSERPTDDQRKAVAWND